MRFFILILWVSAKVLISWSRWMMVDWRGGDERSGDERPLTIKHNTVPCHFSFGAIRIYNLWTICWNLGLPFPCIHWKIILYTIYLCASTEGWQLVEEFAASCCVYFGALVGRQQHQWVWGKPKTRIRLRVQTTVFSSRSDYSGNSISPGNNITRPCNHEMFSRYTSKTGIVRFLHVNDDMFTGRRRLSRFHSTSSMNRW